MRLWHVRLLGPTGKYEDKQWVVATFGGSSILEVSHQCAEACRLVSASADGPTASEMNEFGFTMDCQEVQFTVTGVARL